MLAKTYHAVKAAGAPEDDAIAAARGIRRQNRLTSIDNRLSVMDAVEGHLAVSKDSLA